MKSNMLNFSDLIIFFCFSDVALSQEDGVSHVEILGFDIRIKIDDHMNVMITTNRVTDYRFKGMCGDGDGAPESK